MRLFSCKSWKPLSPQNHHVGAIAFKGCDKEAHVLRSRQDKGMDRVPLTFPHLLFTMGLNL